MKKLLAKLFKKMGNMLITLGNKVERVGSTLLEKGFPRSLYRTSRGDLLWLNNTGYIDLQIIQYGDFEPMSTAVVSRLVKPGAIVLRCWCKYRLLHGHDV